MLGSVQGEADKPAATPSGSNVKVVIRVRPQNETEKEKGARSVVNIVSDQVLVFDSSDDVCEFNGKKNTAFVRGDITRRRYKNLKFAFDYVFGPDSVNVDVYEHTSKSILDGLLNGYNCSVFAYGATGAGKTYTMLGSNEQPGITFLTLMDLYQRIESIKSEKNCEVAVSYLEVYNEQIKDLLNGRNQLPIREDPKVGVIIPGLSLHKPENEQHLMHMLYYGNKNRTQHPTDANAESSRSHAVFQVFVKQFDRTANLVTSVHMAKLSLVDLAGSERGTVSKNNSSRMREGANINRSLLALGNVINMLADNKIKAHIPYRDSKLTRLLKDSIGGNCRTVMIAAISPSGMSYEDTYNTLKYADRAKHIQADLKKNIYNVKSHISKYGKIIENLRQEVSELKGKLQNYENNGNLQAVANIPRLQSIEERKRLQEVLYNIFVSRKTARKEILEHENLLRITEWKIYTKNQLLNKVDWVYDWNSPEWHGKKEKGRRMIELSQQRIKSLETKIEASEKNFSNHEEQLQRWKAEKDHLMKDEMSQHLDSNLRAHHLEEQLADCQRYNKYLKKIISFQDRDSRIKDKTINNLLQITKRFGCLLQAHALFTADLQQSYNQVAEQVLGEKEISWADEDDNNNNEEENAITLERITKFSVLKNVSPSKSLDDNVKKRRASLTPILSRAKTYLNACKDATPNNRTDEAAASCRPLVMLNGTPCGEGSNSASQGAEITSTSDLNDAGKSSNQTFSRIDLKCENINRRITFSPVVKTPVLSLSQTPKRIKCQAEDTDVLQESPLTHVNKSNRNSPSTQICSPANLPSTRTESNLLFVGGGTITKSKPTLLTARLSASKMRSAARSSPTKENIRVLPRYKLYSTLDRKTSTGIQKLPSRTLTASRLVNATSVNSKLLSKSSNLKPSGLSMSQSRRALFHNKSASNHQV